ncbi:pyridoxamine 5'-phosphate oxidase family protein [Azohydromonas sediminis]|uniref:pyridoxamine 5'-phosphate oxidase family protein n=1 Tax=Azohydromonas sediminis TaxID=2259674 RepID=UPI000E64A382|nr:pyridoxamine 5'-phosphate oxidase family protein [Azohydromonas sediminis]
MTNDALDLDAIRACLEGAIPGVMATCAADGTPNVTYVSQVEYVDARHLALSFQFFNKTRRNVLANPVVELLVVHPLHGAMYRVAARYLRTETDGALFERMKAKLAGIASHTGMSGVFRLRGADLYVVDRVDQVAAPRHAAATGGANRLSALRRCAQRVAAATDLDALVERTLDAVADEFGVRHAMLLLLDADGQRLYTVASRGYGRSGAGAEIALGDGVVGVAARMATPIRINHATLEYAYGRTMRAGLDAASLEREIPLPGLAEPGSQLAVPLVCAGQLLGVLFVESEQEMRFGWDDEDALVALAAQVAAQMAALTHGEAAAQAGEATDTAPLPPACDDVPAGAVPLRVRHYDADGSVFFDDDYVIKGVAGAVLWKMLGDHARDGRTEFTNRELRLAPEIPLPEVGDNLEARLVLLTRRLADRQAPVRLEKAGRGRLRLCVARPLALHNVPR